MYEQKSDLLFNGPNAEGRKMKKKKGWQQRLDF